MHPRQYVFLTLVDEGRMMRCLCAHSMKHPIRRRASYLGFRLLRAVACRLSWPLAGGLGRLVGLAAHGLLAGHRRLALEHLARAIGQERSEPERRRIARAVFENLGRSALEWLRLPGLSDRALQQLVRCEGLEHLRSALREGRGVIAVTAHIGNWELIALYLRSLGFEGAVLARRLRYPEYEAFLTSMRAAKGVATLARGSLKETARCLRANRIVGMLPDQDVDSLEGMFVDFFGHPAHTPVGPAALSLMTGAPIVPCFMIREGPRFRLVIEPPLHAPVGADRAEALRELTEAWSGAVESHIRRFPEQWVWMHRRWKTQPDDRPQTTVHSPLSTVHSDHPSPVPSPLQGGRSGEGAFVRGLWSVVCGLWSLFLMAGCREQAPQHDSGVGAVPSQAQSPSMTTPLPQAALPASSEDAAQAMSEFSLTGYGEQGGVRWTLNGRGATLDEDLMTIFRPDAVGYDPERTAHLSASVAQVNQRNRHVRLEHDVTVHTSDGLWLASPVLHWMPDRNQVATELPVRLESDHWLLRGRGAEAHTQLKQATFFTDIELVLNPGEHTAKTPEGAQVIITCDGPLRFDYERHVATFHRNVAVQDPNGRLTSDQLTAYLDPATRTIRYAEAEGHVRIEQGLHTATSDRAIYEPALGKITLTGKPSLLVFPSSSPGAQEGLAALGTVGVGESSERVSE